MVHFAGQAVALVLGESREACRAAAERVELIVDAAPPVLTIAEAIAADAGLGYRIFLVRRYLAMDVILPYVAWITLLAFTADYLLRQLNRRCFKWFGEEG